MILISPILRVTHSIKNGWVYILRREEQIPYMGAAKVITELLAGENRNFTEDRNLDFLRTLESFHNRTRNGVNGNFDLWKGSHDRDFSVESRDHKTNAAVIVTSSSFALNLGKLKEQTSLATPSGDVGDTLEAVIYDKDPKAPTKYVLADCIYSVSNELANAWTSLYDNPELASRIPGLDWIGTARCAIGIIYSNIKHLDEIFDDGKIDLLLSKLHNSMVKNYLWGNDSKNSDRADAAGNPLPYNMLSNDMRNNYAVILATSLDAISRFKIKYIDRE